MNLQIDKNLKLTLFNSRYAVDFFEAIRRPSNIGDIFVDPIQKKYNTLDKVISRIHDAVENKFKIDGTPDFFIYHEDKIAGVFEYHPLGVENYIEFGFWLFSEFRNQGILSRVIPQMIKYSAITFNREKLVATTAIENFPAQKVLERSGFIRNGVVEEPLANGEIEKQFLYEVSMVK
jgi:ribosomal-protein-alanine N-acetyltransferase